MNTAYDIGKKVGNLQSRAAVRPLARHGAAPDQVEFMDGLLALDTVLKRILGFAHRQKDEGRLPAGSGLVLREVFLRGEITRGEVARIVNASVRTAQKTTGELLLRGLLLSDSPKGPVRFGVPMFAAGSYFPNLFPAGAEG